MAESRWKGPYDVEVWHWDYDKSLKDKRRLRWCHFCSRRKIHSGAVIERRGGRSFFICEACARRIELVTRGARGAGP